MPVSVNIAIDLQYDRVLCRQGLAASTRTPPQVLAQSRKLLDQGAWRDLLQPAVACQTYNVNGPRPEGLELENGQLLECRLPGYHVAVLAFAVGTIGPKLEKEVTRLFTRQRQALTAILLDGLGNAALECVSREATNLVGRRTADMGYRVSRPIMPGSAVLPLSQQGKVFELAGAQDIGVTLSPSGVMAPLKSISMVMAVGPDVPAWAGHETLCHGCEMAEKCRYQDKTEPVAARMVAWLALKLNETE